jgi:acetolactate synthase-1/2/3 large subunit
VQVDADGTVCGQAQDIPGVVSRLEDWFDAEPSVGWRASAWDATALEETRVAIRSAAGQGPEPLIAGQSAEAFFAALRRALPRDGILVTDTGVHQVLARRHYDVLVPRGLIVPTDLQSMGFGLPAAIAARLAAPDRPVVGLVGDGSLLMNGFELATAAHLGLCLPVVVFVDGYLNQIRLHQQSDYGHDWGTTLPSLEIAAIADATGAAFADGSAIEPALADALRRPGPTLIAVPVGDSPAIEWRRRTRRAKEAVRGLVGAWLLDRIRGRRAP